MMPRTVHVALATLLALPVGLGAQDAAPAAAPQPVVQLTPANPMCDCVTGDDRGRGLRNLAAFAPLGFIGALAASGAPAVVAEAPTKLAPSSLPASLSSVTVDPATIETPLTESGRAADIVAPADSLTEQGLRAPDTATPLPSVLLLGSGLLALGAFAVARSRG
jgi:hypothetical protein